MEVFELIGMEYRLGAEPLQHHKADCLSLSRYVLSTYGIETPVPERSWYRRLRKKDYSIFPEQLELWGCRTTTPKIGVVGLIHVDDDAFGLATYWEGGWISFVGPRVKWSPIEVLQINALYCPQSKS